MHALAEVVVFPKVANTNEARDLAMELGLQLQAARYEKPLAENVFTQLSDDERTVWAFHCPTRYVPGGGDGVRALEQYAFDSIPLEVMRHWKKIKDNYAFDRFEVWTTERTRTLTDPLLIGVIGTKLYLLARWGMESPDGLSIKAVAERIIEDAKKEAPEWVRLKTGWFGSSEEKKARSLARVMDWICYHGSLSRDEAVQASFRVLGMRVPQRRFVYYYD